jgi:formylglycine-generating enzyme required for sulfatase activity
LDGAGIDGSAAGEPDGNVASRDAGTGDVDASVDAAPDGPPPLLVTDAGVHTPGDDLEVPTGIVPGDPAPAGSTPSCAGWPTLPAVAPGKRCPENVPAGQVCLEEGWVCTFHRAPGETQATPGAYWWDSAEAISPVPPACMLNTERAAHISPVFVRGIRMDIHEFTNGDLVDLLAALPAAVAAQVPVPPERTGERPLGGVDVPDEPNPPAEPYTGWFGRTFRPLGPGIPWISYESPVVGLNRSEAIAICKARGGRLPLIDDFQRASRGLAPTARVFPWGDEIPTSSCPTGYPAWNLDTVPELGYRGVAQMPRVTHHTLDRTPGGVRFLMSGAHEWTATPPDSYPVFRFTRTPAIYTAPPFNLANDVPEFGIELPFIAHASLQPHGLRFAASDKLLSDTRSYTRGFRCVFDL